MSTDNEQAWRDLMLGKLDRLEEGQNQLKDAILDIKTSFATSKTLDEYKKEQKIEVDILKNQIEDLRLSRSKLWGMIIGVNLVVGAIWSALGMWILYVSGHIH